MTGPAWLPGVLAGLMLLIAVYSAGRLIVWRVRGRDTEPETDALHALMGVAMAGMFEPRISPVPGRVWLVVFAAAAALFGWRVITSRGEFGVLGRRSRLPESLRCAHPAAHLVECAAMIYMLVPAGTVGRPQMAMPGMTGQSSRNNPALALVFTLFMLGYILWIADRLASQSRARAVLRPAGDSQQSADDAGHRGPGPAVAPRSGAFSKIAMSAAMGYMLLTTL